MSLLRMRDLEKMNAEERRTKRKELAFLRMKGTVTSNRATSKTKEIKRALARIFTMEARDGVRKE